MQDQHAPQHTWLDQLIGSWSFESECQMGPGQPPMKTAGTEIVRSLGGLWTIGEGTLGTCQEGETPGKSIMTLGFDPRTGRFLGTFIASMMTHLWVYDGSLDASGKVLTLDTIGPSFASDGQLAKYQDIIEFVDEGHRILRSNLQLPDGSWTQFMEAHYRKAA